MAKKKLRWTEALLRDQCWAERRWWWMPGSYLRAAKWCDRNCPSAICEIDAAAFTFKRRKDFDKFRRAFPDPPKQWMFDHLKQRVAHPTEEEKQNG